MELVLHDSEIESYLEESEIVDFGNKLLIGFADRLIEGVANNIKRVRIIYEYVRDEISHSFDIGAEDVTCRASEVLEGGHGVCYAKSHLLVALLRSIGIPSGFCYQGLIFDDIDDRRIILHGMVGVFIKEIDEWIIRLDARGNKPGVNAEFCLTEEKLAYLVRPELGEFDTNMIYSRPIKAVVECLLKSRNRDELIQNLPEEI